MHGVRSCIFASCAVCGCGIRKVSLSMSHSRLDWGSEWRGQVAAYAVAGGER